MNKTKSKEANKHKLNGKYASANPEKNSLARKPSKPKPVLVINNHIPAPQSVSVPQQTIKYLPQSLTSAIPPEIPKYTPPIPDKLDMPKALTAPVSKKYIPRTAVLAKKSHPNIDLFKDLLDKSLGVLGHTLLGGLIISGFIGTLQFVTKYLESGMSVKHTVMFTISAFLLGTILDKD